jgi:hypothetical protein
MAVEAGATERAVPKPAERVSRDVGIAGFPSFRRRVFDVQQSTFFGGEDEEAAVDESEELLEIGVDGKVAGLEAGAERFVGWMDQKSGTEDEERLGDAGAETVTDAFALFLTLFAPGLPRGRGVRLSGPAGMEQPPDGGKVGVALFAKDEVEAFALYSLAGVSYDNPREARDGLEKVMSPIQIAEGKRRTKELQAQIAKSKSEQLR